MKIRKSITRTIAAALSVLMVLSVLTSLAFKIDSFAFESEDNFQFDEESGVIWGYNGDSTNMVIPSVIHGVTVTSIGDAAFQNCGLTSLILPADLIEIGPGAFSGNALTSVILPENVLSVGSSAFANNHISSVSLPEGLESMGSEAFRNNDLTDVTLPATITALSNGVFMQNLISAINLEGVAEIGNNALAYNRLSSVMWSENLTRIGSGAFSYNQFISVDLPDSITDYGAEVFAYNERYVLVSGGNGQPTTYSVAGGFGEITKDIRTLTIKFETMDGETLLPDKTITSSLTKQAASTNNLTVDGNVYHYNADQLAGYAAMGGDARKILIDGDTTHVIRYIDEKTPPTFSGVDNLKLAVNAAVDLVTGVTATDVSGNDITDRIQITVMGGDTIDTSYPGTWSVKYYVKDDKDRSATVYRTVLVADDPMNAEIGNGWLYGDFTYADNGATVTGLSASGTARFNAGNKDLVLPGVYPTTGVIVEKIKAGTSTTSSGSTFPQQFTSISFSKASGLKEIGSYAFAYNSAATEIDLGSSTNLERIGAYAFYNAKAASLDFSSCVSLATIGGYSFYNSPAEYIDFSGTPKLTAIEMYAFYNSTKLVELDLSGHKNLTAIGSYAFGNAPALLMVDLSGCSSLTDIGIYAFRYAPVTYLNVDGCKKLENIGTYAFYTAKITELDLSSCTALTTIGARAFYSSPLAELNMTGLVNLTLIDTYAFPVAKITSLDLSSSTKITAIGSYAFRDAQLTELDLGDFTRLTLIDAGAFQNSALIRLNLRNTPLLKTIGSQAFRYAELPSLDLTDCVELTTIGSYAFYSSPLVVLDLTKNTKLQVIDSYAFYGANLTSLDLTKNSELTTIGDYAFYYTLLGELDLTHNPKLTTIGNSAFYTSRLTRLNLSSNPLLTTIGSGAFYSSKLASLDTSHNIKLASIGDSAFYSCVFTDLDFSKNTELTYLSGFNSSSLTNLDLTQNTKLQTIGSQAFRSSKLTSLDLSRNAKLSSVGDYAFYSSEFPALDFSGNPELAYINSYTFYNAKLTDLDLSHNPKLAYIYDYAFASSPLTSLDLSNNPVLAQIRPYAFYNARLTDLDLSSCTGLTVIYYYAFNNSPLSTLDLRPCTKLTAIYYSAFNSMAHNAIVYLPDSVTNIKGTTSASYPPAFGWGTTDTPKVTWVYTTSSATKLTDLVDTDSTLGRSAYVFINKVGYMNELYDDSGNLIRKYPTGVDMSHAGETVTVPAPPLAGYTPVNASETMTLSTDNHSTLVFIYTKGWETRPETDMLTLTIANAGNTATPYVYNNSAQMRVNVSLTADLEFSSLPADSEIIIPMHDRYLNLSSIVIQADLSAVSVKSWYVRDRELHLVLKPVIGGTKLISFPIYFSYYSYITPYNHVTSFDAYLLNSETGEIVEISDPARPAMVKNTYSKDSLYNYVNGTRNSNVRIIGGSREPGQNYLAAGSEVELSFGWSASQSYRYYDEQALVYTLPTYIDKDGLTRTARFDPARNPAWTLSEDGKTATMTTNLISDYSTTDIYIGFQLKLSFPEARIGQSITHTLAALVTPLEASDEELEMLAALPVTSSYFYRTSTHTFILDSDDEVYPEFLTLSKSVVQSQTFYDTPADKSRTFEWNLQIALAAGYEANDIVIKDYNLDKRFRYTGIYNPNFGRYDFEVIAYDSLSNELLRLTPLTQTYYFPENIRDQIDHLIISYDDLALTGFSGGAVTEGFGRVSLRILTEIRDPEGLTYANATSSGGRNFYNYASMEARMTRVNTGEEFSVSRSLANSAYYTLSQITEQITLTKASTPTGVRMPGDPLSYSIRAYGYKYADTVWKDVVLLDLLPEGFEVTHVTLNDYFINGKYEFIDNYKETGQTALLITADEFSPSSGLTASNNYRFGTSTSPVTLVSITGKCDYTVKQKYENTALFKATHAQEPARTVQLNGAVADIFGLNNGKPLSQAKASNDFSGVEEIIIRKYIRTQGTGWVATEGIRTPPGSLFDYRITLYNHTNLDLKNLIIYDIFPYIGDTYIEETSQSAGNIPRQSQFSNVLAAPVQVPEGWTVYYTEDKNAANNRDAFQTMNWSTGYTSIENVRGVKITADDGTVIDHRSKIDFVINMQAPEDPDGLLMGKKAVNSASRSDSYTPRELEGNYVSNQIWHTGDISIRKVGEQGEPLEGAFFQLVNTAGEVVQTLKSGADGRVIFKDIPFGSYSVKERTAPAGYYLNTSVITINPSDMVSFGELDLGDFENIRIPDPPQTGSVKLVKHSIAGHILKDVQFRVTGLSEENANISVTGRTNKTGVLRFDNLPLGSYLIEEIKSVGHLDAHYSETFTIEKKDEVVDLGTVLNGTANFTLLKIGIYSAAYQELPNEELDATMGKRLAGVGFELYDDEENLFASGETAADGTLVFKGLEIGKTYTLLEIGSTVPAGFVKRDDSYEIRAAADGKLYVDGLVADGKHVVIGNNAKETDYHAALLKVDQDGSPIAGVLFKIDTVKTGEDNPLLLETNQNGEIDITKAMLTAHFGAAAPDDYYVTEAKAPGGYIKTGEVWHINVKEDYESFVFVNKKIHLDVRKFTKLTSTVYDTVQYLGMNELIANLTPSSVLADLSFIERIEVLLAAQAEGLQIDIEPGNQWALRKPLAGAVIRVYDAGNPKNGFTETTDTDGILPVPEGFVFDETVRYLVEETAAPEGFIVPGDIDTFDIPALKKLADFDGSYRIDIDNAPVVGRITVTKLDRRDNTPLSGVQFNLYRGTAKIATRRTDDTGIITFGNLPFGVYSVVESEPKEGYETDPTVRFFTIGKDAQYQYVTIFNDTIAKRSDLIITKTDGAGTPLAGIGFYLQVWDNTLGCWERYGNPSHVAKTNSRGQYTFRALPAGRYRIIEATDIPELYGAPIFSGGNEFTVSGEAEKVIEVGVVNPPPTGASITMNIERKPLYVVPDRDKPFIWYSDVDFGNRTADWDRAVVTIRIDPLLEFVSLGITENDKDVPEVLYHYTVNDGLLTVIFSEMETSYAYLSHKKYTLAIETMIKESTTEEQIDACMEKGGIPSRAELAYSDGPPLKSEIPVALFFVAAAEIGGHKTWDHGENPPENQPAEVVIYLWGGSEQVDEFILNAGNNWSWSATVPQYDSQGRKINYTVTESPVPSYRASITGLNIHNTFIPSGNQGPGDSPDTGDIDLSWAWIALLAAMAGLAVIVTVWTHKAARRTCRRVK